MAEKAQLEVPVGFVDVGVTADWRIGKLVAISDTARVTIVVAIRLLKVLHLVERSDMVVVVIAQLRWNSHELVLLQMLG